MVYRDEAESQYLKEFNFSRVDVLSTRQQKNCMPFFVSRVAVTLSAVIANKFTASILSFKHLTSLNVPRVLSILSDDSFGPWN